MHRARRRHATPIADDFCVLPPDDADISATLDDLLTETRGFDLALRAAPIVAPGFAFIAYPYVAAAFRAVFELIKNAPYVEVDGAVGDLDAAKRSWTLSVAATVAAMECNAVCLRQWPCSRYSYLADQMS